MQCPKCSYENREDAQFCLECGEKLALKCFECGKVLPLSAKYCDGCGHGSTIGPRLAPAYSGPQDEETGIAKDSGSSIPADLGASLNDASGLTPESEITPRTKLFLFVAIFYAILLIYLSVSYVSPASSLTRIAGIFQNFWANFIFLGLCFLAVALLLYGIVCFFCRKLLMARWSRPKLGKVLVGDGYITKEQLREALGEQEQRIGEVLVQGGRITVEQLDQALDSQKKSPAPLGDILREMGYATEEDVNWALGKLDRRLGEVLRDRGLLTERDLDWVLGRQQYKPRRL
ncbi:MAG: zinc-ribbon domain-containing protein [Desulfobacteraceae bacterium]|jgi:hypothetical protein